MLGCYLFFLLDKYGTEVQVKESLEEVQDFALGYVNEQYMTEVSTMDELRKWQKEQADVQVKFYHLNFATLDMLEEL